MSVPTQETNTVSALVPRSRLFWGTIVAGVLMIALGWFLWVGPLAGMLGVWGLTAILLAVLGAGTLRLWSILWT